MSDTNLSIASDNTNTETKRQRGRLDAETFVQLWQTSNNIDEFCEKTGESTGVPMQKQSAYSRSRTLRKDHGIPLKRFKRAANTDWDALKAHALSFLSEDEREAAVAALEADAG
jgi:hypothetical protein